MQAIAVIPARLDSTRLARKMLREIAGQPLIGPEHIATMLELMSHPGVEVGTLKTPAAAADIDNPAAVKVVTDAAARALYFSRATIPYPRDGQTPAYFKHLGFYAYRKAAL